MGKSIGSLVFNFGANLSGFDRAMNKAQKSIKKFGKSMQRTGRNLSRNLTMPIVALGAVSLKTFADFEQSMLKVKAISGATGDEFKDLTDSAKLLGSTTMFTASQVAELQLNLSKLGLAPKEINKSTGAILNLAQATDSDLAESATVAASVMNAFGLEAEDMVMISDVMADAFSSTALDLIKFQTAMASVAPVAKQAGQDIQGTSAILGVLVNNGIEASSAGTALRNVFLELANKGLTWDEAMIKIQSSLNPLKTAMDLFGKRGAAVATIIANNGTEIQNLTEDFRDSSGEAQAMADIMDSGVGGAMRRMRSQLEGVAIEVGEQLVPIFTKVIEKVEKIVEWFSNLSDAQKKNIVRWAGILAVVGPVLMILGKLTVVLAALPTAIAAIGTAIKVFMGMMTPFNLILVAIGALIAGLIWLRKSSSDTAIKIRNYFTKMSNGVRSAINTIIDGINMINPLNAIKRLKMFELETEAIKENAEETGEAVKGMQKEIDKISDLTPPDPDGGNGGDDTPPPPGNGRVKQIEAITLATKALTFQLADYNVETKLAESVPLEKVFDTEPVNKYREIFGFFGSWKRDWSRWLIN